MRRNILFILFLLVPALAFAQQPVQVNTILRAPYTLQLSDYYASTQEKLIVTLVNRDLNKPVLAVRLRMTIESQSVRLRSRDFAFVPPLQLEAGVPLRLSLADLAPYFNPDNLDFSGITRAQYLQEAKLPEGFYQFCFEAIEVSTEQVASAKGCAMAWISLSDPPFLNLPLTGEAVALKAVQNIIFQWTPRHLNSPNSAFVTEYDFQLAELWDNTLAPEVAFQSVQPLYQVTTRTTTLLYGPAQPLLIPGKRYAWRVRAHAKNGVEDVDVFRNQGNSEIRWFTYQDVCPPPTALAAAPGQFGNLELTWLASDKHQSYTVSYKRKDKEDAVWFDQQASSPIAQLYDVEAGIEYDIRVGAFCVTDQPVYGDLLTIKVPTRTTQSYVNCSIVPDPDLTNREEIQTLKAGDIITAGDFPVKITEVSGSKEFTGKGYVTVPFLGRLKVSVVFSRIHVNTKNQLIQGSIITTTDAKEGGVVDVDEVADIFRDYKGIVSRLKDFSPNSSKEDLVQLVDKLKDTAKDELPADTYKEVEKSAGELLAAKDEYDQAKKEYDALPAGDPRKEEAGKKVAEAANKFNEVKSRFNGQDSDAVTTEPYAVTFKASPKGTYGFDAIDARYRPAHDPNYKFTQQGNEVAFIPWKAVPLGSLDWVDVHAATAGANLPGGLAFRSSTGAIQATPTPGGASASLNVYGYAEGETNEIVAYLKKEVDGKEVNVEAGKLNVVSYGKINNRLVLVPVNDGALPAGVTATQIERDLNAIYSPAVVTWSVQQEAVLNSQFDQGTPGLNDGTTGLLSSYTNEMETILGDYTKRRPFADGVYYLFLVGASELHENMGYMPRSKQAGFIFMDKAAGALTKTMAHELGHGAFNLLHTFQSYPSLAEGTTDNLMDYTPGGVALHKYQWDLIHDPEFVIPIFDNEETGAYRSWTSLDGDVVPDITGYEKISKSFISIAGIKITLPANSRDFTFINGYLSGFTVGNERYVAMVSARVFRGYYYNAIKAGSSFDISKAKPYAERGAYDAAGKTVFYVLGSGAACGTFTLSRADYMSAVGEKNDGGIGMAADQYLTRKINQENVLLSNHAAISTMQSAMDCLTGRTKELFKFIEDHYAASNIAFSDAYKADLVTQLRAFNGVFIRDLDGTFSGNGVEVRMREMLSYGHIEFLANLKKAMAGGVAGKTLVVQFEDYNHMRDLYYVYQIAKEVDVDCVFAEKLVTEIDRQLTQTGTVTFNLEFVTALAKTTYELGNEVFELLNCVLKNLKVPESVYNPNRLYYKSQEFYISLFTRYLQVNPAQLAASYMQVPAATTNVAEAGAKYGFACTCGVWNSVVDLVYGLTGLAAGVTQYPENFGPKLKAVYNQLTSKEGLAAIGAAVWTMMKEHHGVVNGYGVDGYQATYGACYDAVLAASMFIGVGELKLMVQAARGGEAGEIARIIAAAATRYAQDKATSVKDIVSAVANIRKWGTVDPRLTLLKLFSNLPERFKVFFIDGALSIRTADGSEIVRFSNDGIDIRRPTDDLNIDPSRFLYQVEEPWTDARSRLTGRLTLADDGKGGVVAFMHVDLSVYRNDAVFKQFITFAEKNITKEQRLHFTIEEFATVAMYTSPNKRNGEKIYQAVNRTLRERGTDPFYNAMTKILSLTLSKVPVFAAKELLYRGTNLGEAALARTWKVGEVVEFRDFKSSSLDREYAKKFAQGEKPVLFEVSNALAYDIRELSALPLEEEFLFKPGGKFKVLEIVEPTDASEKAMGMLIVRLEYQWFD